MEIDKGKTVCTSSSYFKCFLLDFETSFFLERNTLYCKQKSINHGFARCRSDHYSLLQSYITGLKDKVRYSRLNKSRPVFIT